MSVKHAVWSTAAAARELLFGPAPVLPGLRILCYHSVGGVIPGDPYGLSAPPDAFRRQMEKIALGSYGRPTALGGAHLDGSSEIAVTFDDGFADTLKTAAPILAKLKIPFTVCVTAAFARRETAPHLSLDGLRELAQVPGAEIGAHGANHLNMALCEDDILSAELAESKKFLEDALSKPIKVMTWPHGSASQRTAEFARRAGFVRAGCSLYGLNEPGRDALLLKRTEITGFDSDEDFARKCTGGWDFYALRQGDPAQRS